MSSEIETCLSRAIEKLDNNLLAPKKPKDEMETQEANYRMQKKIAGAVNLININNISFFDSNQTPNETSMEISNSFSEAPSEIIEQSVQNNTKTKNGVTLDLNRIINIGEYKIELRKLLFVIDKIYPDNKENIQNNDSSNTQCTTEIDENEKNDKKVPPPTLIKEEDKDEKKEVEKLINDKQFEECLKKKSHKLIRLLKTYLKECKLMTDLNKLLVKDSNNNNINNILLKDISFSNMNMNCRRQSLFDMSSYIIPSETSINSFGQNKLPNFNSNFFDKKKIMKSKKRNTYVSGQLKNKLKKINEKLQVKSMSKQTEDKIIPNRTSLMTDSNNNTDSKKSVFKISNFDINSGNDSESIIDNDNSVFNVNDKRTSFLFNNRLSAVKKRRESDFFDNVPQQQEEITGFHKMISTIVEEEDKEINDKKNVEESVNENGKIEEEDFKEEDFEDDEFDEETIINNDSCYYGNINSSLCFDNLNID